MTTGPFLLEDDVLKELEALRDQVKRIRGGLGYSDEIGDLAIIVTKLIDLLIKSLKEE